MKSGGPGREPIFNVPGTTLALAILLALAHWWRVSLGDAEAVEALLDHGFIPARARLLFDQAGTLAGLGEVAASEGGAGRLRAALAALIAEQGEARPATFLSYAFLHGDLAHLATNLIWLLAFGSACERRFGALRFVLLCLTGAVAGAAAHALAGPLEVAPLVGASAVVAACTGAAVRFAFAEGGPLSGAPMPGLAAYGEPAPSLRAALSSRRALAFVGVWLVMNLVVGLVAEPLGITDSPVAWVAHLGGFAAGLLLFGLLDPVRARTPRRA